MNTTSTATSLDAGVSRAARFAVSVFSLANEAANAAFSFVFEALFAEYYYYYYAQKRFVLITPPR